MSAPGRRIDLEALKRCVDFVIITIKPEEFDAVLDQFHVHDENVAHSTASGSRDYTVVWVPVGGPSGPLLEAVVAITRCGTQGNGISQDVTRDIIADLAPPWILLVGIAGGVPASEFSLGDVVLGTSVLDFSVEAVKRSKKANRDADRAFAVTGLEVHPAVENFSTTVAAHRRDLGPWSQLNVDDGSVRRGLSRPAIALDEGQFYGDDDWRKSARESLEILNKRPSQQPTVVGVPIGSSDRLIKDTNILKQWLRVARQVRAVEMESSGVHIAARGRGKNRPAIPAMSIRGISDIVGYLRDESWTVYACHSAAAFAYAFVRLGYVTPRAADPCPIVSEEENETRDVVESTAVNAPISALATAPPADLFLALTSNVNWGISTSILQGILNALRRQEPSAIAPFNRACAAADLAVRRATEANVAMTQARGLLVGKIPADYKTLDECLIIDAPKPRKGTRTLPDLGAAVWSSGDEYFGQVQAKKPSGIGVYKIYRETRFSTPALVHYYRGEIWDGQFGLSGVYEFANGKVFAGEWVDGRPRLGILIRIASPNDAPAEMYDIYGGSFGLGSSALHWLPDGFGVAFLHSTGQLTVGTFDEGRASNAASKIPVIV